MEWPLSFKSIHRLFSCVRRPVSLGLTIGTNLSSFVPPIPPWMDVIPQLSPCFSASFRPGLSSQLDFRFGLVPKFKSLFWSKEVVEIIQLSWERNIRWDLLVSQLTAFRPRKSNAALVYILLYHRRQLIFVLITLNSAFIRTPSQPNVG